MMEIDQDELTALLQRALAPEEEAGRSIVWQSLDSELAVNVPRVRVAALEGLVLVGLPVRCDQAMTGVELVVPLAVGTPDEPAGLVATAETAARGNSELVVAVWGPTAVAATWLAFLDVCQVVAARAGEDDCCRTLLPGAVWAMPNVLGVVPQARHAIDYAALG
jgi:hypothetical protein